MTRKLLSLSALPHLMIALLGARAVLAEDAKLPDSAMGRIVSAFIDMLNGDDDAVRRFEETHRAESARKARTIEDRLGLVRQLREDLGKIRLDRVLEVSEHRITALVQAEHESAWLTLGFEFEPQPPGKLVGVRVEHTDSPELAARQYTDWKTLAQLVEQVQTDCGAPGVAIAIVRGGNIVDKACAGVRELGKPDKIEIGDLFHIGSVTKSVTATMIAKLIELGMLTWDITLAEALPDIQMNPEYSRVTLRQLLTHRGGIPQAMNFDGPNMRRLIALPGNPTEQRAAYAAEVLLQAPIVTPGTEMRYSNAGYAIAGLIAERAAKKSWEELVAAHVFKPLNMSTSGFGWPATLERPAQPLGHTGVGAAARATPITEYALGNFISPAGNVHCSIEDLARYAAAHVKGLRGVDGTLKSALVKRLHEPAEGPGERYACGWTIDQTPEGVAHHWHNGSAGTFYAMVSLFPADDLAVVCVANAGDDKVEPFLAKAIRAIQNRKP